MLKTSRGLDTLDFFGGWKIYLSVEGVLKIGREKINRIIDIRPTVFYQHFNTKMLVIFLFP